MNNRLTKNALCPIHRSRFCCGRARKEQPSAIKGITKCGGVTRIPDEHHPRGYREIRTPAELRRLKDKKIREQEGKCGICHKDFTDYRDIVPDHIDPRGCFGAFRDDHPSNIQAAHSACNQEKGSQRNYVAVQYVGERE